MASRTNAMSEITRFWLQSRHGCVVDEAVPVKVTNNYSDIDLIALRPDLNPWFLPDGSQVIRAIVETKDEHDFDPSGKEFGKYLRADAERLGDELYIAAKAKDIKFSMLRQEHFEKAAQIFGVADFDRLFVVHALDPVVRSQLAPTLAARQRIHWITIREVVGDLQKWYPLHQSKAALRYNLIGDLWHLLVGYCGLQVPVE